MATGQGIGATNQLNRCQPLPIDGDGQALLKADVHIFWRLGSRSHRNGHGVDLLGRLDLGIFEGTGLNAATQQVEVDGIGGLLAHRCRNAPAFAVGNGLFATHAPFPGGSEHLEFGRQGTDRHIEAHLVIPLTGTAMGHGIGAHLPGHLHQASGDQRSSQGGRQGIATLIEGIGPNGWKRKLANEGFDQIFHPGLTGAGIQGLETDRLEFIALAEIGGQGDHLFDPPLPLEVGNANTGVDAAGIGQHHAPGPGGWACLRLRLPAESHQCRSCFEWMDCGPPQDSPPSPPGGKDQRAASQRAMAAGGPKTSSQTNQGVITRGWGQCLPAATSRALNPRARSHSQATWRHLGSCIEDWGRC